MTALHVQRGSFSPRGGMYVRAYLLHVRVVCFICACVYRTVGVSSRGRASSSAASVFFLCTRGGGGRKRASAKVRRLDFLFRGRGERKKEEVLLVI